jgi:hypothetical protein
MPLLTLADLIAQVESNGNPLAVRFESDHNPATHFIVAMMQSAACSYNTAKILCSMSWGKFQIMGDELMSLGLTVSPLALVHDDDMQVDFFNRYCLSDHLTLTLADILTDASKRQLFARLYNGPGNVGAYVLRIEEIAKANGLTIS